MLKAILYVPVLLVLLGHAHAQGPSQSLRGNAFDTVPTSSFEDDNDIAALDTSSPYLLDRQGQRHLQEGGMQPLSCNDDYNPCVPWSLWAGTEDRHRDKVIIPCGECVIMDHAGERLILSNGLDIQGKLIFPNEYRGLTLYTTMIVVQGELEMRYFGRVTGTPLVTFIMIGNGIRVFEPIGENTRYCGQNLCVAGKKAIMVAGGRAEIRGLPSGTKTWVKLYDVTDTGQFTSGIVVEAEGVWNRWGEGAEILITSHTNEGEDQQVRRVVDVDDDYHEDGYVRLLLDNQIRRPTTILDDDRDFAVEVALLSRHIVFEGGPDDTQFHGAHFWIFETTGHDQVIEGVDFVNFGQAGELGRYPIHAHLCGDLEGSVIARNTIRDSNQRCIVVHGTDNLEITDNDAFNNAGHCFMLEDGVEMGNRFIRNLGAQTKRPGRIIPSRGETDGQPATFWMPSLGNSWIDNVAAGCIEVGGCSGYWFEPMVRGPLAGNYPDLKPEEVTIVSFEGNVAHSNGIGIKTYPDAGLRPMEYSPNRFVNLKVYRNIFKGLFVFFASNLIVEGGIFADNSVNLDIDQSLSVSVQDVQIVGETDIYSQQIAEQGLRQPCLNDMVVGLQLNTDAGRTGATIYSALFSGFSDTRCDRDFPARLDAAVLPVRDAIGFSDGDNPLGDIPNGLFINCGSVSELEDESDWQIDQYYENGQAIQHNPDEPSLVNQYREQDGDDSLDYTIPVNRGRYSVDLYWAEFEYREVNARKFDVFINGMKVLDNLDVYEEAGARGRFVKRTFYAFVSDDEQLQVTLVGTTEKAFLTLLAVQPVRE